MILTTDRHLQRQKKSKDVWLKGKEKEVVQVFITSVFFTARHTPYFLLNSFLRATNFLRKIKRATTHHYNPLRDNLRLFLNNWLKSSLRKIYTNVNT